MQNNHSRSRIPYSLLAGAGVVVCLLMAGILIWIGWQWQTLATNYPFVADTIRIALALGFTVFCLWAAALLGMGLYNRWASRAAAYADKEIAHTRATVQVAPLASSFTYSPHIETISPPPPLQLEQAADDIPSLPLIAEGQSRLAQLRQMGHICRSGNSLLVGYTEGKPSYIELPECGFIGVGGQPRVGKSSTSLLLIEQAILSDWHVFVADPHVQKADGLLNRCKPFSGRLAKQAVSPDEISDMIRLVDKIGRRRVEGDPDRTPCILVIDEFSNLVWRGMLPPDVLGILPSMAAEYAGVGVHGVLIAHDWSKASLGGDLGAALRRAITHRLIHRMSADNVEFLLPRSSTAQARAVMNLDVGRCLFWGLEGANMVSTHGWATMTRATPARAHQNGPTARRPNGPPNFKPPRQPYRW